MRRDPAVIAFDESGNTGSDLLNEDQPVFVVASVNIAEDTADEAIATVEYSKKHEPKFSTLKRSSSGQERIYNFLKHDAFTPSNVKVTIYHKQFLATIKIVDMLVENLFYRMGIDLYQDGGHIALSNLHFFCMPVFCGKKKCIIFTASFIRMMRERSEASIREFYLNAKILLKCCKDKDYRELIEHIIFTEEVVRDVLLNSRATCLDPAVPAFFDHCAYWNNVITDGYEILHDESKPIFEDKEVLEALMSKDSERVRETFKAIGYGRDLSLPIRTGGIQFADSKADSRLQVADMFASSTAYWVKGVMSKDNQNHLWRRLDDVGLLKHAIGGVWPSKDVTPEAVGWKGKSSQSILNGIGKYFKKK